MERLFRNSKILMASLEEWKLFIESDKDFFDHELSLFFIVLGPMNNYFDYVVSNFDYPFTILFDEEGNFLECNEFIENPLETFLLDENNTITMKGSPLNNEGIYEVYKILLEKL